jgi:membrane protein DedA with SNARE-associated domain
VGAAAIGAICGDQIGYMIGRWVGFPALKHWGGKLGLTEDRFELGRYLFHRYGGRIVFFGRFVAFLRTFAAVLAGANQMPWHSFLIWNALGGIGWTGLYGFGAYLLGALGVIGATVLVSALIFIKRNEARLTEEARQDMARSAA